MDQAQEGGRFSGSSNCHLPALPRPFPGPPRTASAEYVLLQGPPWDKEQMKGNKRGPPEAKTLSLTHTQGTTRESGKIGLHV